MKIISSFNFKNVQELGIKTDSKGYQKKQYRSSESDCKNCPLREQCCGKVTKFKKLEESIHKPYYDRMHEKLNRNKLYTKRIAKKRSSTVEPVLGTLINYFNMKKINSRGMAQANKHVLMSALTYNLKKHLKFIDRKAQDKAQTMEKIKNHVKPTILDKILALLSYSKFSLSFGQ